MVDRTGARPVLLRPCCALRWPRWLPGWRRALQVVVAALLAGVGNAPFHPADFTILNKRVRPRGSGMPSRSMASAATSGWAVAPVLSIGLMNATGNWRAVRGHSAGGARGARVLWLGRAAIDDRQGSWGHAKPAPGAKESIRSPS